MDLESFQAMPDWGQLLRESWEEHALWWQQGFTDGADAEYEEQIIPIVTQWLGGCSRVVDLGGGSTELVAGASDPSGEGDPVAGAVSLDVGCVRVTERFLDGDPPDLASVARASEHVAGLVRDAVEKMPALAVPRTMVGVAGTVATLATLSLGLDHYERERVHHAVLTRATVGDLASELLAEPAAARAARPGVEPERADVIAAGALVLAEVMAVTGHEELVVSESDILDGIAAELRDRGAEPHGT